MATIDIPDFLDTQSTPALLDTTKADMGAAQKLTQETTQGYDRLMNSEMQQFDFFRNQETRRSLMYEEKQTQVNMDLPGVTDRINQEQLQAVAKIAAINESQTNQMLKVNAQTFANNTDLSVQNSYYDYLSKAKQSANPDGSGYAQGVFSFINNQISNAAQNAPSDLAKMSMNEKLFPFKLQALKTAFDTQYGMQRDYNVNLATNAKDQLLNRITSDPENAGQYFDKLDQVYNTLKINGLDEKDINKFKEQTTDQALQKQVQGFLTPQLDTNGNITRPSNTTAALSILHDDFTKDNMNPQAYSEAVRNTVDQVQKMAKQGEDGVNGSLDKSLLSQGILSPAEPGFSKASDSHFQDFMKQQFPQGTIRTSIDQIPATSAQIASYFETNYAGIGSKTKTFLNNVINSSANPNESAAYAMALSKINNDGSKGQNIFTQLDNKTQGLSSMVSKYIDAGIDAPRAITMASDAFKDSKDPSKREWVDKALTEFNKDTNASTDILRNVTGNGLFNLFPKDQAEKIVPEVQSLMRDQLYLTQNKDLAVTNVTNMIQAKYGVSSVNPSKDYMLGAPEKYLSNESMNHFRDELNIDKQNVSKLYPGIDLNDIYIKGIEGTTAVEAKDLNKFGEPKALTYQFYSKQTGLPVLSPDGPLKFRFTSEDSPHGEQVSKIIDKSDEVRQVASDNVKKVQDTYNDDYETKLINSQGQQ